MKVRCMLVLLLSMLLASTTFGEDVDSRLKALEERYATRHDPSSSRSGEGRLRLLDLSMDALVAAGTST